MKLRPHGPGRWRLTWELGRDPATGRRRQKTQVIAARTKTAAKAVWVREQARLDRLGGRTGTPGPLTVGAFLDRWLATKQPRLRPSTYESYGHQIRLYLRPALGTIRLDHLMPAHIQQAIQQWAAGPRADGRAGTLAPRTVQYAVVVLRMALDQAVRWNLIAQNPAAVVEAPSPAAPPPRWWTAAEAARFLAAAATDELYGIAFVLLFFTGMRLSELLGLRWQDVDWDRAGIWIRQTRTGRRAQWVGPPKTRAGQRFIPIDAGTLALLQAHRDRQARCRGQVAGDYQEDDLVVATGVGTPPHPRNLNRSCDRLQAQAGIPRIKLHEIRHTHGSLLREAGADIRLIADRLGHSQASFTAQVYVHARAEAQRPPVDTLAQRVRPVGDTEGTCGEAGVSPRSRKP